MRALLALVLLSSTASADRSTVFSVGVSLDDRATGPDFGTTANNPATFAAGARATLAFEDAQLPIPAGDWATSDVSLVPELLGGFLADDTRAEGYIGAGARLDVRFASNRRHANQHTALYGAGRALIIGKHQDSATEFAVGGYLSHGADLRRFGWEISVVLRPQDVNKDHELDGLFTIYTAWR
jgi:hypothetical protein